MRHPHPHPLFRLSPHSIMTRQHHQDQNYHSGPLPSPEFPQQPGQSTQPFQLGKPNPRDTYSDRPRQYKPPKDSNLGSYASGAYPQPHLNTSQKNSNSTGSRTHQQGRQDLYGYPSTGSSSNDLYYPGGGLVNGGGDNYLPPGGGYNPARPQDRRPAGYDRGHDSRPKPSKRPARPPANTHSKQYI
ncbi:hypothetical protein BJV77DRAFT_978042 [Russula vinacea]|nr:hypothetical protein BJV77DRAFT_978042 [Russula vinacea]